MASLERLKAGIIEANKRGDEEAVRILGAAYRKAQRPELSASEMASNFVPSAVRMGQDIATAVMNPIDTVHSIGKVGDGVLDKFGVNIPGTNDNEPVADAVGGALKDRYGSRDAIVNTFNTDPVGAFADVAGLLTGGATTAAKTGTKIAPIANKAARAASALDPVNLATRGVTNAVQKPLQYVLRNVDQGEMYADAAKFSTTMDRKRPGTRSRVGQTALDEGVRPNDAGLETLRSRKSDINAKVDSIVAELDTSGSRINSNQIESRLLDYRDELLADPRADSAADVKAVDKAIERLRTEQQRLGVGWTPDQMQSYKRDLYNDTVYGQDLSPARARRNKANQEAARGAKESIEFLDPGIQELNAEWGRIIELEGPLSQSAARLGNNNPISLDKMVAGAVMGQQGGNTGMIAGMAAQHLLNSPGMRIRLAELVNKIKKGQIDATSGIEPTLYRYALTLAGRTNEEAEGL